MSSAWKTHLDDPPPFGSGSRHGSSTSLIAVLTLGVATVLIWPDLVTISLSAILDDDVRELPSYHQFVAVAALTFFGSALGMLGLRSPAAALAG